MSPLVSKALEIARTQIGVREKGGRNRGPEIDGYVLTAGLDPSGGHPYCAAFVHWCFYKASLAVGMLNVCPKTAGVLKLWNRAPLRCRLPEPIRGAVFIHDSGGGGKGHTGFVEAVIEGTPGYLVTIEGNTNGEGSRDGDGVYRKRRELSYVNVGYLDFSQAEQPVS